MSAEQTKCYGFQRLSDYALCKMLCAPHLAPMASRHLMAEGPAVPEGLIQNLNPHLALLSRILLQICQPLPQHAAFELCCTLRVSRAPLGALGRRPRVRRCGARLCNRGAVSLCGLKAPPPPLRACLPRAACTNASQSSLGRADTPLGLASCWEAGPRAAGQGILHLYCLSKESLAGNVMLGANLHWPDTQDGLRHPARECCASRAGQNSPKRRGQCCEDAR